MSRASAEAQRSAGASPDAAVAVAAIAFGTAALLLRPFLVDRGAVSLVALYPALLVVSIRAPLPPAVIRSAALPPLHTGTAMLLGFAALAGGTFAAGPILPAPPAPLVGALAANVLAAVAEEALFRRLLYGTLARFGPPIAVVVSAATFAAIHVPAYGTAALWVDFGAGLLLGWQRWASGGWTAPAATHVAANVLAVLR
jgi:membrane protease YdiL (CAAX protease family)